MRRALAVVLVGLQLFLAPIANARVAVIVDNGGSQGEIPAQLRLVSAILDRFGVEYDVVPNTVAKTEWCRTGVFNMGWPATNTLYYKTYAAVIHCNLFYDLPGAYAPNYRPDSLNLTAKLPLVPQIFIGRNTGSNSFTTITYDSSGVAFAGDAYSGLDEDAYGYGMYLVGSPYRWKFDGHSRALVDTGTVTASGVYSFQVVPGGFRPLVAASMTPAHDAVCHDCDSLHNQITGAGGAVTRGATIDTLLMWVRQNLHVYGKAGYETGAAHNIFVLPGGAISSMDQSLIVMALAYADSQTNGGIFNNQRKIPARAAIHIDDGWRRTADNTASGGIAHSDTAILKQTIDSLASLRVPFVVGVAVDSMIDFANQDSIWWERAAPYVHYTPHVHGGAGTVGGGAGIRGIQDMYAGAYAFYKGESCEDASGGQSVYCLARHGFWHLEERFPGRVDHVIMPPLDDWSPSTMTTVNAGPGVDSLFWVWSRAGARGVRTNGNGGPGTVMGQVGYQTNPQGYFVKTNPAPGSGSSTTGRFNVYQASGYMTTGYSSWTGWKTPLGTFLAGFLSPGTPGSWTNTNFPQTGATSILALHVTDLAGSPANNVVVRPGWWQVKYAVNRFNAINKLAGRTIVEFVYPEDIADVTAR